MRPEPASAAMALDRALAGVVRRGRLSHAMYAAAAFVASAAALMALGASAPVALAIALSAGGIVLALDRKARTRAHAAVLIERAVPASRNAVITAQELLVHPERASAWMRGKVIADAAGFVGALRPSAARPLARPALLLAAALVAAAIGGSVPRRIVSNVRESLQGDAGGSGAGGGSLAVVIEPPSYTGLPPSREVDPARIEALEGSTVRLSLTGAASSWRLRFGSRPVPLAHDGTAVMRLTDSGYFALEPGAASDGGARLVPVTVTPDRAPSVHIDAPARDLMVPDASRRIAVTASASDDLGLDALELRYTKVSGTGEDFEFVEGTLPVTLTRTNGRAWRAATEIALGSLQLEAGDSLVYRAVAKDHRPDGTGEASSDTFFIEIAGPGQVGLEGFELPPEQERYALSQQMIVLKIERLRARERVLSREALQESTAAIAAEQRAVRANFIFLMGGHVEDEEVEAEQSSEIQEGRLENSARREISTAIHLMTRAEQGLVSVNTATALPPAKSAVDALQRAFGRNRYILRTPPSRAEIDPSRRLSGTLSAASSWRRDRHGDVPDPKARRLDAFVEAVLATSKWMTSGDQVSATSIDALAEQALAVEPGAPEWQQIAARLTALRDLVAKGGQAPDVLARLGDAVRPALDMAQRSSRRPAGTGTRRPSALGRAWAEEARR